MPSSLSPTDSITVLITHWQKDGKQLRALRKQVFIDEQNVSQEEEWDGLDDSAIHVIATTSQGHVVGTARILPSGQIGRMAVLREFRGFGLGARILQAAVNHILSHHLPAPFLHAQTHAIPFYEKLGFVVDGDLFMDAGIPHRNMVFRDNTGHEGA